VVEGAVGGGLGVAEVVASLLDGAEVLADRGFRNHFVGVDELILLRAALPHRVVPAALREGVDQVGQEQQG